MGLLAAGYALPCHRGAPVGQCGLGDVGSGAEPDNHQHRDYGHRCCEMEYDGRGRQLQPHRHGTEKHLNHKQDHCEDGGSQRSAPAAHPGVVAAGVRQRRKADHQEAYDERDEAMRPFDERGGVG